MEQGERELQVSRGEAGRWRARARHVGRRSQQQPVPVVQQRRQRQLVDKARYQPLVCRAARRRAQSEGSMSCFGAA
eukprot:1841191-Prymnesium_polylepis.1